ncbi:unnamed protein product [Rotaria sordida]|uniref:Microbial-type PARG catalytic domain-containing protein n=1 Tax=Rotaria sordida TaxID=392033 RepID=A0A814Q4Y8_9BILA|nr:unnamed protein product [Rotaria sordida]CAF1114514.1 unnamed protein product [Rotaria sordida]CAF3541803.1 unnamed protein product [Rotaria sordida]CAF3596199.1 unnamed protein product [Rotaria sordida]
MSIALAPTNDYWTTRVDRHQSRRTMLKYLLTIRSLPGNSQLLDWIDQCAPSSKINWNIVEKNYIQLKNTIEPYQVFHHASNLGTYWEMKIKNVAKIVDSQARPYIARYRTNGFKSDELKIYWNYQQIRDIIKDNSYNSLADIDARKALLNIPVHNRNNRGTFHFVISPITDAVFQVPQGKQIIVLDFADERMPGGYFIEYAKTQEEAILYHSDGYRALLDLKYKMMDGGYMLPEFGGAYIKRVRFFRGGQQERLTDLIVAACYDVSGKNEGLYQPPSKTDEHQMRARTLEKFRSIIASAVANTEGSGKNTYLLLGPIGTGAFVRLYQQGINEIIRSAYIFNSIKGKKQ